MQAKKSVFRPIALAVSALISTGAFAETIVTTDFGAHELGRHNLELFDNGLNVLLTADRFSMSSGSFTNPNVTEVTALGIRTDSLSASSGGALAVSGLVDFTGATVQGLTGSFNPSEVTSALIGGTMVSDGTNPSTFQRSGYSVDLSTGAATLGATTLGATTLNGATTVNNTLNVNGATTVVGATSITGATTVVGTTNINTTGTAATSIGNSAAPVAVTGSTASFTGGTTNLTLNNNGATFSNAGSPVKVTGIANGTGDFDAVNVRQFSAAVAGVAASANIPGLDTNKTTSVGVGMGSYMKAQALAFGGSYRFSDKGVLRATLATGLNSGGGKTSFGIGAGWSW